jgi:hypothetical protein
MAADAGTPRRLGWGRWVREACAMAFFLGLAAVATRPLAMRLGVRTLAGGDPLVDLWTVSWIASHVFEPSRIFEGNTFHPAAHAVLFSDPSLGTAVLLVPLRALVEDPLRLYNLGVLLALAFGGWCFHLLVRDLTGSLWAGLLAGTLAGFSAHQLRNLVYLNLLTIGWLALFLLGLHRCVRRPSAGAAILTGLSFALTAQSSGYYAVAAVVLALVFAAVHWRDARQRQVLVSLAGAALLAVLLTLPFLWAYSGLYREHGLRRPPGMSERMAFQPARDLTSRAYVYRGLLGPGGGQLFPGLLAPGLAVLAAVRRRPHALFYSASVATLLLLSFGPQLEIAGAEIPMPYAWLRAVPPLDGMRHPVTFAGVALLAIAVLAGLGWASLGLAERAWTGPLVVALAVAETLGPAPRLQSPRPGVPPVYRILESLPAGPVLEVPVFNESTLLVAARRPQLEFLNGQGSAFIPNDTRRLDTVIQNTWLKETPPDVDDSRAMELLLERFPVRYVVLPLGRIEGLEPLAAAFDRSRLFRLVRVASDGDRLYERTEAAP